MSPTPDRIRSMRTVTAMVALDTVELIAERVCNLLAHGRRVSMTERYTYVNDAPSLAVGLTLDGEPKLWRRDGGVGLSVQLKPGLTAGFGLSAYADEAPTEARAWARYHHEKGYDGKPRNLTVVDIQGGLTGDGPARDDQLVIHGWNTHGVCVERVIGFDYDAAEERTALQAILLPHTPKSFAWPDVLVEAEAQAADVRLYEEALGVVIPDGYDADEAFPATVRRWWDDLTSEDPVRQARARGEEIEDGDDFDGSTVDATGNPHPDALYDGARAPESCDIDGSHDEVRPRRAVSPGDPDWVDGFGPLPGSGSS